MQITPSKAHYIKLGPQGTWEDLCIKEGTLRLGFYELPHEYGLTADQEAARQHYVATGVGRATATGWAKQFLEFYGAGRETLWFTFSKGYLWWAFAVPGVEFLGQDANLFPHGSRLLRTASGWSNTSIKGDLLRIPELNGELTKIAAYRQTICKVTPRVFDYLVRKINGEDIPEVVQALAAKEVMVTATEKLIKMLQWRDFELLVDLVFSQTGWRRTSMNGGDQKTLDMEIYMPTTGEKAIVQVKSSTSQAELDHYCEEFGAWGAERMFYIYHTATGELSANTSAVTLIGSRHLAELCFEIGLCDWVIKKTG